MMGSGALHGASGNGKLLSSYPNLSTSFQGANVSLRLPPEFRPSSKSVGRRTYNLAYVSPLLDSDLKRNLEEAAAYAKRHPVLIEIVGEGCRGEPSFIDEVLSYFQDLGFQGLNLPRIFGHQTPLSLIRLLLGLDQPDDLKLTPEHEERLWLLDPEAEVPDGFEPENLSWMRLNLIKELLSWRFDKPSAAALCAYSGELDLESLTLLEKVLESIHDLRLLIVLNYDERIHVPGLFSRLNSFFIRYVPEIGGENLGTFGRVLEENLPHEQFEKFLRELTPSLSYTNQLRRYFDIDLDGRYDRRLNYPLTPIQLFLSRWQRLNEKQRNILLALALQQTVCDSRRLESALELPEDELAGELDELLRKGLIISVDAGYTLADTNFFTWSVDFSDHQLAERLTQRHLEYQPPRDSYGERLMRLDHHLELHNWSAAREELGDLLDYLMARGLQQSVLEMEKRIRELLKQPLEPKSAFDLLYHLVTAALGRREAETAARLVDDLKAYATDLDDDLRGLLAEARGRLAELRNDVVAAADHYRRAVDHLQSPDRAARVLRRAVLKLLQSNRRERAVKLVERFNELDSPAARRLALLSRTELERVQRNHQAAKGYIEELQRELAEENLENKLSVSAELELGRIAKAGGQLEAALEHFDLAHSIARRVGFAVGEFHALSLTAMTRYQMGELEAAIEGYLESLTLLDLAGHSHEKLSILNNLGLIYHSWGFLESALSCLETCEKRFTNTGDLESLVNIWANLGMIWLDLGFIDRTQYYLKLLSEGKAHPEQSNEPSQGNRHIIAYIMANIAEQQGNPELAERLYRQAAEFYHEHDMRLFALLLDTNTARMLRLQERFDEAAEFIERIRTAGEDLSSKRLTVSASLESGELMLARLRFDEAAEWALAALEVADRLNIPESRFRIYWLLTRIHRAQGETAQAAHSYQAARDDLDRILADFNREDLRAAFLKRPRIRAFLDNAPAADST